MTQEGGPEVREGGPQEFDPEVVRLAGQVFDAARGGDPALVRRLLDAGAPPNLTNDRGDTLVMLAAYHGHAEAVRVLLEHGADPNRINDRGQSPLAGAVFKGTPDVVRVLLEGGADPNAGRPSALEAAMMFERRDMVELLTSGGGATAE
ncbi:ankyrin repeat domain-containing protein [Allostreptomyces psammosilenae]|uniref:Ankyrin repeat domain-containing protein n=1 Tax=Allostreptomyces psammosilenae TaxID=1892865 RepID=A0A852ZR90_9ACTN|nr:ankyrin repeat domain-containing protein [Allostreptomyces psammosilenae]NYI04275.1 hypothetical protein [Allostreptomyces psammosilenae]